MLSSADVTEVEAAIECPEAKQDLQNDNLKYTIFTKTERWCIVALVSYATWSSNVCGFIYYPALKLLSERFSVSVSKINLTSTSS
jgi:hypothetical protein